MRCTRYRGDRSECAWLIKENKNRDKFEISARALPLNNKVSNEFIIIIFVSRPAIIAETACYGQYC
jgi:hypothetical protein